MIKYRIHILLRIPVILHKLLFRDHQRNRNYESMFHLLHDWLI